MPRRSFRRPLSYGRRGIAGLAAIVLGLSLGSVAAQGAGEKVQAEGKVVQLADGDTPYVDVYGDGTSTPPRIRMNGIQAAEVSHPDAPGSKTWCHGPSAENRLNQLIMNKHVQLRSMYQTTVRDNRPLRTIFVRNSDGSYSDVQRPMLSEGYVIWFPEKVEWTHNREYHILADQASTRGHHVWNTDSCGYGPNQGSHFQMWVNWDADGDDGKNVNGEFVVIKNLNKYTGVSLAGWHIRDSSLQMYTFPSGAYVPAGGRVYVHSGKGTNTSKSFYMGLSAALFENVDYAHGIGDGAYLLDPDGDYRAWFTYPCVVSCTDPLKGKLAITKLVYDPAGADTASKEYVRIKNISSTRVNFDGYFIRSWPYTYAPLGAWLGPGETMTLHVGKGTNTHLHKYWGMSASIFNNTGDEVDISNYRNVTITCKRYGNGRCPQSS